MSKRMLKGLVMGALVVSVLPAVTVANAEDILFGETIVTGTRVKTDVQDVAANITVINNDTLEAGNYTEMSQALQAAGVDVVDHGSAAYPILNGDSRVLVMVNGRRVNFDHLTVSGNDNAVDMNQIPMDNVEHIEVVRGPNSALYGQKAVAGVINIITKTPTPDTKTTVSAEYGTWNQRRGSIVHSGGDEDNRYMITYAKEKRGNFDYKDAKGDTHEFQDSYINREEMTFRYDRYFGDDRASFDFSRTHAKDGYGIYLADVNTGQSYGKGSKLDSRIVDLGVTYTFNQKNNGEGTFLRLSRINDQTESPFGGTPYEHDLTGYTFEGQKNWKLGAHNLVGGFMWEDQNLWESNDGSTMDRTAITKAVFAEDRWELGNGWSTNMGGRFEHHSDFGGDWTYHVGLNKRISNDTHAYLSYGTAVNNPTLKMRYADTPYMKGNPNLEQETSRTITLGVDSKVNDKMTVSASVYQSKVKDALNWAWNGVTRYYNIDEEDRRGLSLSANYKVNDNWRVRAGYDYSKVEINDALDLRTTRPNGYTLGVTYDKSRWNANANVTYVTGRSMKYYTDNSYFLVDMNVNYQWTPNTKLYVKGFNLTNEHYETSASAFAGTPGSYAMPARHFVAGVSHSF